MERYIDKIFTILSAKVNPGGTETIRNLGKNLVKYDCDWKIKNRKGLLGVIIGSKKQWVEEDVKNTYLLGLK